MTTADDIINTYKRLSEHNVAADIPGTEVPGHGVFVDGISGMSISGIPSTGMYTDNIGSTVTGIPSTGMYADNVGSTVTGILMVGAGTDTVDPKSMRTGSPANTVKTDGADPKATRTGENTDGVSNDNKNSEGGKEEKDADVADNFHKLTRPLKVFSLAEEFTDNVKLYRMGMFRFCYDMKEKVCIRLVDKPTAEGGNITNLLRNNVCFRHSLFVSDSIAKDVFSWLMDREEFSKVIPEERFNVPRFILLNNGYYDLAEDNFVKCDDSFHGFFFSVKVDADYVVTPLAPLSNEFFSEVCLEATELVLAACGILLSNVRSLKKAFFFLGPRNSGKTTMGNFVGSVILPKADFIVRALSLAHIGGRFSPSELMDAHHSWAGDIGRQEFTRSSFDNFKTLTGNDPFEAEGKFKDLKKCKPKCALAFNCNHFPRFPMAWDYDSDDNDIEEGAGRNRIVLFHTRQTYTDEMQIAYRKKNGMTVDQALAADKNAIVSEMIRQAGRVYRGEMYFPVPAIGEIYSEGKTLKERFFFLVETQCYITGNPADVIPLQELISAYKCLHSDEILPYKDPIAEERAFGALLNYVIKLDPRFVQAKRKVPGYPNPVSCLIGCRLNQGPKLEIV